MRRGGWTARSPDTAALRLRAVNAYLGPDTPLILSLLAHSVSRVIAPSNPMLYIIHICSLLISGDDEAVASSGDKHASEDHAHAEESAGAGGAEWSMLISGPGPRRREEMETEKDAFTLVVQKFKAAGKRWPAKMNEKVLTQVYGICKTIVPD